MATSVTRDGRRSRRRSRIASAYGRWTTAVTASTRFAGRSSSATGTSTRPRPTATKRASGRVCARAASRAARSSSRRSSIPAAGDPAAEAQRSLERLGVDYVDLYIIHWPQGGPPGPGRGWSGLASLATHARSASPISTSSSWRGDRRASVRRWSTRCSSVRTSTAGRCSGHATSTGSCSRPTARWEPGRHLSNPTGHADRRPARAHAGAGAAALVRPARHPGDPQVDPPRADRGECADLRFRADRRGHGRARRARPDRGDATRARAQVVVNPRASYEPAAR